MMINNYVVKEEKDKIAYAINENKKHLFQILK